MTLELLQDAGLTVTLVVPVPVVVVVAVPLVVLQVLVLVFEGLVRWWCWLFVFANRGRSQYPSVPVYIHTPHGIQVRFSSWVLRGSEGHQGVYVTVSTYTHHMVFKYDSVHGY